MLDELDVNRHGALLVAITRKTLKFLEAVLDSKISEPHLKKLLGLANFNRENCIHSAISKGLDPKLSIRFVEMPSKETLAAQDGAGLTPLHYAVDYTRCTDSQLGIFMALVKYGDKAFDRFTGEPDLFSVYRYHLDTRQKYEKKEQDD